MGFRSAIEDVFDEAFPGAHDQPGRKNRKVAYVQHDRQNEPFFETGKGRSARDRLKKFHSRRVSGC